MKVLWLGLGRFDRTSWVTFPLFAKTSQGISIGPFLFIRK